MFEDLILIDIYCISSYVQTHCIQEIKIKLIKDE